jgi:hypothetical protein
MLDIVIDKSAEEIGLAAMLADLIRQNVASHPERKADFDALKGVIVISASDAEVELTLDFKGGRLEIFGGRRGSPDLSVATDSMTILELNNARLIFGFPDLADPVARGVAKKILSGGLKLRGPAFVTKPGLLPGLNKLMSVAGPALAAGEAERHRAVLHPAVYFWPVLFLLAAAASMACRKCCCITSTVLFLASGWLFLRYLVHRSLFFLMVTDRRVVAETGGTKRKLLDLALGDVEAATVSQCPFGKIFGYGTVVIRKKGGGEERVRMVSNPGAICGSINSAGK